MNLVKNRVAAFGAAGALAAGSVLAGGVLSPAAAGTDNAEYTCNLAGTPTPLDIAGSMNMPAGEVQPGASLSGLATTLGVTLPGSVTGLLTTVLKLTEADGQVTSASFPIGDSGKSLTSGVLDLAAPVPLTALQPATLTGIGTSGGTAPTTPGTYNIEMPESFVFTPASGALPPISCVANETGVLGQLVVAGDAPADEKEGTTTRAKFLNTPLTTAKKPDILVRVVQDDGDPAAGVVVVKKGKKILKKVTLNDNGKKRFRIAKLKRGEHRLVFKYKGNADSLASKVVKTIRVRRA